MTFNFAKTMANIHALLYYSHVLKSICSSSSLDASKEGSERMSKEGKKVKNIFYRTLLYFGTIGLIDEDFFILDPALFAKMLSDQLGVPCPEIKCEFTKTSELIIIEVSPLSSLSRIEILEKGSIIFKHFNLVIEIQKEDIDKIRDNSMPIMEFYERLFATYAVYLRLGHDTVHVNVSDIIIDLIKPDIQLFSTEPLLCNTLSTNTMRIWNPLSRLNGGPVRHIISSPSNNIRGSIDTVILTILPHNTEIMESYSTWLKLNNDKTFVTFAPLWNSPLDHFKTSFERKEDSKRREGTRAEQVLDDIAGTSRYNIRWKNFEIPFVRIRDCEKSPLAVCEIQVFIHGNTQRADEIYKSLAALP